MNSMKNINDLPSISQTIKEYNLSAKKKLSQNFILDLNLTNKIINLSDGIKHNTIIEIGPGPGSLTRSLLLNGAKKVIAIEKDRRFIEVLKILNIASNNKLVIEHEDARCVHAEAICSLVSASNPCPPLPRL